MAEFTQATRSKGTDRQTDGNARAGQVLACVHGERGSIQEKENVLRMDGEMNAQHYELMPLTVHLNTLCQAWWYMSASSAG